MEQNMKNDGDMGHASKLFKLEICPPPSSFFSVDNFGRKPNGRDLVMPLYPFRSKRHLFEIFVCFLGLARNPWNDMRSVLYVSI